MTEDQELKLTETLISLRNAIYSVSLAMKSCKVAFDHLAKAADHANEVLIASDVILDSLEGSFDDQQY